MEHGILNIFPEGSLASSVTTTVFIGVIVSVFFNLRFGWVLSGLVVPGYLAPILIAKPWAGFVIFIESVVTYFLVWELSEHLSRPLKFTNLFGRDRFFAFLIFSMFVRVLFDVFFLPYIGEYINNRFLLNFDYRNNLHSFGLIIVALMANQYWKPGFFKGLTPQLVTILITYLIVRYILMEWTNFTISNLSYIYEDIATSILASPKSYIILITTALIASRMNLQYGWEYSGILIPSLLALLWYNPAKIVATVVESLVILQLGKLSLRLPMFKNITIEKGRKIMLFFTISFLYKYILSYILIYLMPGVKISDYYGFGYLLPTLVAIKMHDKDITLQVTRSVVQTSFMALIVASIIGYGLTLLNISPLYKMTTPKEEKGAYFIKTADITLFDMVMEEKIRIYQSIGMTSLSPPTSREAETFKRAIRSMEDYTRTGEASYLKKAQVLLSQLGYRIYLLKEGYLYIRQDDINRGWGSYVFNPERGGGLVIEVPLPIDEWGSIEAGARLFNSLNGYAMAIGGISTKTPEGKSHNPLIRYDSLFQEFHLAMAHQNVLQIRRYTGEKIRWLSGERQESQKIGPAEPEPMLFVKSSLPQGLDLSVLKRLLGTMTIEWGKTPYTNMQRESMRAGFAELLLNREDIKELFFKPLLPLYDIPVTVREQRIDGYLQDWLLKSKWLIADKGSNLYKKPTLEELLFFDNEVLTPLLYLSRIEYSEKGWTEKGLSELRIIASASALLGYKLILYKDKITNENFIILVEDETGERRHWGTYVLRLGEAKNYIVQIPRPLFEVNVFEYGVSLFARLKARVVLIGGTHPFANNDLSSDLIRMDNRANLFNLVNQVILRESGDEGFMTLQCRALGLRPEKALPPEDVLLTFDSGVINRDSMTEFARDVVEILEEDGLTTGFVDGRDDTTGYEASFTAPLFYIDEGKNKEFGILWLSPFTRTIYKQQTEGRWQNAQFKSTGIPTYEADLYTYILRARLIGDSSILPPPLLDSIKRYVETQDILELYNIRSRWSSFRFIRIIDINTKQSFLLVYSPSGRLILVANLTPKEPEDSIIISGSIQRRDVSRFIDTRSGFLKFGGNFEAS